MITKIILKKVASYGEKPVIIETDKKVNLIYWLNGTGKTTISRYLQNINNPQFSECSIEWLSKEKILVYNQQFIDDNFYEDTQKGIFSLKTENKQAKETIDKAIEKIGGINKQIKNDEMKTWTFFELEKVNQSLNHTKSDVREKIWEIKNNYYSKGSILEFCLDNYNKNDKSKFFEQFLKVEKPITNPTRTIEDLIKETELTQWADAKLYNEYSVKKVNFSFLDIENHHIFKEVIVWNENSQIAELIKKLDNSDWIKKGIIYVKEPVENNEICPFCQKDTISKTLYQEIYEYFDETYTQKISLLQALNDTYWREYQNIKNLEEELLWIDFIKNQETEFKLLFKTLISKLGDNRFKITNKVKTPNVVVNLESSLSEKDALNKFLDKIIIQIQEHNVKVKNKEETRARITNDFRSIMRWNYASTIDGYEEQTWKIHADMSEIELRHKALKKSIEEQEIIIQNAQKEMVNIQGAVDVINSELIFFWLDGFSIIPANENSYKLKRPNEDIASFATLSEWEKTVISFLYFLELCKGKTESDEVVTDKIIVIDDPISSLSSIYVFNVAQLIKKNCFDSNYKQIFVLTHNLYFFHELVTIWPREKPDKAKFDGCLFRVSKRNQSSVITTLGQREIQNDYQSYWHIIKDYDEDGVCVWSKALLSNAMRNILEYFFGFMKGQSLNNVMQTLDKDQKYQFFVRYMNRESHSDMMNISDMKEIDPQVFKEAFKKIFEIAQYPEHYNIMMEEK